MRRTVLTALTVALLAIPAVGGSAMAAPTCGGMPATIVGDPWSQLIVGTFGPDVIVGRGGHDTILALGGDDVVCGDAGRDTILGGRGADRLFGENGHDRLVGGSGFDELDGGDGRDRCNVGRDGGTETDCERGGSGGGGGGMADLVVTMSAPGTVNHEEDFTVTVTVTNKGNAPSGTYDLTVDESLSNVECGPDRSGSDEQASLGAGEARERVFNYGNGCLVLENAPGQVSFEASVQPSGSDSDASNNSASRNITVDPPSQG